MVRSLRYIFLISFLYSCSSEVFDNTEREPERNDVFISTYKPSSSGDILITGGRVLTGTGDELEDVAFEERHHSCKLVLVLLGLNMHSSIALRIS